MTEFGSTNSYRAPLFDRMTENDIFDIITFKINN